MIVQSYRAKVSSDLNDRRELHLCANTSLWENKWQNNTCICCLGSLFSQLLSGSNVGSTFWCAGFAPCFLPPTFKFWRFNEHLTRRVGTSLHFLCPASIYTYPWPGPELEPLLFSLSSLAQLAWSCVQWGALDARALPVTSVELLLDRPDVNTSTSQASRPRWWAVSSIPFQKK